MLYFFKGQKKTGLDPDRQHRRQVGTARYLLALKVHKRENFLDSDIEICTFL